MADATISESDVLKGVLVSQFDKSKLLPVAVIVLMVGVVLAMFGLYKGAMTCGAIAGVMIYIGAPMPRVRRHGNKFDEPMSSEEYTKHLQSK